MVPEKLKIGLIALAISLTCVAVIYWSVAGIVSDIMEMRDAG